jgi:hypothetical protein
MARVDKRGFNHVKGHFLRFPGQARTDKRLAQVDKANGQ